MLAFPTVLDGRYRLDAVIGRGAAGVVYSATHTWTQRRVAVKVLDHRLVEHAEVRERFLREARASVQLQHPHVVDVLDFRGDNEDCVYMVMELLQGMTLRDELELGVLSPARAVEIVLPLIDALEFAHQKGIVHRDLKPENIMLAVGQGTVETPKLLDFGVAQILQGEERKLAASDGMVGTPEYMAPEQSMLDSPEIGPQSDVWAMGMILYECVTGDLPFERETPLETLAAVREAEIPFEAVPDALRDVIARTLSRDPDERIDTMADLRAWLEDLDLVPPARRRKDPADSSERRARSSHIRIAVGEGKPAKAAKVVADPAADFTSLGAVGTGLRPPMSRKWLVASLLLGTVAVTAWLALSHGDSTVSVEASVAGAAGTPSTAPARAAAPAPTLAPTPSQQEDEVAATAPEVEADVVPPWERMAPDLKPVARSRKSTSRRVKRSRKAVQRKMPTRKAKTGRKRKPVNELPAVVETW